MTLKWIFHTSQVIPLGKNILLSESLNIHTGN